MMLGNRSHSSETEAESDDTSTGLGFSPAHVSRLPNDTVSRYDPLPSTLWVSEDGFVIDCCAHTEEVFGFWRDELRGKHISTLLPDLKNISMVDERGVSPALAFLCQCVTPFCGVNRAGIGSAYSIVPHLISSSVGRGLMLILRSKIF
jgi:hypothetical protein